MDTREYSTVDNLPPDPNAEITDAMTQLTGEGRFLAMAIVDRVQVMVGNQQLREDEHYRELLEHYRELLERTDAANNDRKQIALFLEKIDAKLDAFEARTDALEKRVGSLEKRVGSLERRGA